MATDALRALNHAAHLQAAGNDGVELLIIDSWTLGPHNVIPCNELRRLVGLTEEKLFSSESLVWRCIPNEAILTRISWSTIANSLGKALPPISDLSGFDYGNNRPLQVLRDSLHGLALPISDLMRIVLHDFQMPFPMLVVKQLAMTIFGWTRRRFKIHERRSCILDSSPVVNHTIVEIDYRMYLRAIRRTEEIYVSSMADGTEKLDEAKRKTQNYEKRQPLTLTNYLARRLHLEKTEFKKACKQKATADDLIPLLKKLGFEVEQTAMQRPRV